MLIAQTDQVKLFFEDNGCSDGPVIISFAHMDFDSTKSDFWGQRVFQKLGLPVVGFVCSCNCWYPVADILSLILPYEKIVASYGNRIIYGFSMGAYGGIKHSGLLKADYIIALSPQWSIDPSDVYQHDRRLIKHFSNTHNTDMKIIRENVSGKVHLFCDPYNFYDVWNAEQIQKSCDNFNLIKTPMSGHETVDLFASADRLNELISQVSKDNDREIKLITARYRRGLSRRAINIANELYKHCPSKTREFYEKHKSRIPSEYRPPWCRDDGSRRLRVLIATNHLVHFTGSEIVAMEVAEWFRNEGHDVVIVANYVSSFFLDYNNDTFEINLINNKLRLSSFDIIWNQHNSIAPLLINCKDPWRLPLLISVSLSPYEKLEHPDCFLIKYLCIPLFVNSIETLNAICRCGGSDFTTTVFNNAAPNIFWQSFGKSSEQLTKIVVISNHIPEELFNAIDIIQKTTPIEVRIYGGGYQFVRISPEDIAWADCIISIGKSVPYALALLRPIYIYDQYGGDGWLNEINFVENAEHNFSGRPNYRKISSEQIVFELSAGYSTALAEIYSLHEYAKQNGYVLDPMLDSIIKLFDQDELIADIRERFARGRQDDMFTAHVYGTAKIREYAADIYRHKMLLNNGS